MKLTDAYINKLNHLDKDQFFKMDNVQGLEFINIHLRIRRGTTSINLKTNTQ